MRQPEVITVEINCDWFRRILNVHPKWSIEDTLEYMKWSMHGGGKTQRLIMLGERVLEQMREKAMIK